MNDHSPPPDSPNFHCSSSAKVYFIPGPTIPALPFTVPSNYKNTRNLPSLHQTFSMSDLVKSTAAFRLTVVLSQNPRGYPVRWCEILSKLDQFIKNEIFSLCYWDHWYTHMHKRIYKVWCKFTSQVQPSGVIIYGSMINSVWLHMTIFDEVWHDPELCYIYIYIIQLSLYIEKGKIDNIIFTSNFILPL